MRAKNSASSACWSEIPGRRSVLSILFILLQVNWYFNDRNINTNRAFCEFSNIGDTYAIIFNPAKLENAGYYKVDQNI